METIAEGRAPVTVSFPETATPMDAEAALAFINKEPVHTGERALAALTSIFASLAETIPQAGAAAAAAESGSDDPVAAAEAAAAAAVATAVAADNAFQTFSELSGLAAKIYDICAEDIAARYKETLYNTLKAAVGEIRGDGSSGGVAWNHAYDLKMEAERARDVAVAEAKEAKTAAAASEAAAVAEAAEEAARIAASNNAEKAAAVAAAAVAEAKQAAEAAKAAEAERDAIAKAAEDAAILAAAEEAAAADRAAKAAAEAESREVADTLAELNELVASLRAEHGSLLKFNYLSSEPPMKDLLVPLGAADSSPTLFALLDPDAPESAPLTAVIFGTMPADQKGRLGAAVARAKGAKANLPAYRKLHGFFENIYEAYPYSAATEPAATEPAAVWSDLPTVGAVFGNILNTFTKNIADIRDERLKCAENKDLPVCKQMNAQETIYGKITGILALAPEPHLLSDVSRAILSVGIADVTAPEPSESVGEFIASHLNFMDGLFPVRTVVNFRTEFQSGEDTENAKQNMRDMLVPPAGTTALGKDADLHEFAESDHKDTQFRTISDSSDSKIKYGPFFRVITDSRALNVSNDMESMFAHYAAKGGAADSEPKHYMYSGFGYSGSGKTFALLKNPSGTSVLHQIAKAIQAANDSHAAEGKAPYTVKCYAYDYYGEIRDAGCEEVAPDPTIATLTKPGAIAIEDLTFFKVAKQQSGGVACTRDSQDLKADKSAETIRAVADRNTMTLSDLAEIYEKPNAADALGALSQTITDYRARTDFAPAAGGASAPQRYHIRATPNNDESSRSHFFIDMYVTDGTALVGRATVLDMAGSEKVGTIQDDYFSIVKLDAVATINANTDIVEKDKERVVAEINKLSMAQEFSALRPAPWIALHQRFVQLAGGEAAGAAAAEYDDLANLVLLHNAYNHLLVAFQYEKVYNAFTTYASKRYGTNFALLENFAMKNSPDFRAAIIIHASWKEYRDAYEAAIAQAESDALMLGLLPDKTKIKLAAAKRLAKASSAEKDIAEKEADLKVRIARLNGIKAKYHCPIRYQGNFINASLHWLKLYVTHLANGGTADPGQLSDTFTNTLMRQNLHDPDPNKTLDRKFVLMTNVRLDFGAAGAGDDARRKNYRDAATLSLQFAHCINPFASKSPGYFDCEAPAPAPAPAPAQVRPSSAASRASSKAAPNLAQAAAEKNKADAAAAAAAAARNQKAMTKAFEKKKEDDAKAAALARIATPPALPRGSTAKTASTVAPKQRFRGGAGGGAYDPTAETSLAHVQALGLVVLFALSIGLAERTTSPTRERTRPGSAPHPAVVRAGFTVAFLIFYTLTTLLWAALGVASFGAYITHLFFFYTLVGTFTGVLFKKKSPAGSILAAFVLSLTAFFADA